MQEFPTSALFFAAQSLTCHINQGTPTPRNTPHRTHKKPPSQASTTGFPIHVSSIRLLDDITGTRGPLISSSPIIWTFGGQARCRRQNTRSSSTFHTLNRVMSVCDPSLQSCQTIDFHWSCHADSPAVLGGVFLCQGFRFVFLKIKGLGPETIWSKWILRVYLVRIHMTVVPLSLLRGSCELGCCERGNVLGQILSNVEAVNQLHCCLGGISIERR